MVQADVDVGITVVDVVGVVDLFVLVVSEVPGVVVVAKSRQAS